MKNIKDIATDQCPKASVSIFTRKEGGELTATPSNVPRNRQQISNA